MSETEREPHRPSSHEPAAVEAVQPASQPAPQIVEQIAPLLQALPQAQREAVLQVVQTSVQYQGPLPPPQMMAEYNRHIPNGADRMMRQFEKQTDHRIETERTIVNGRLEITRRGQDRGFLLCVLFGLIGLVLAMMGHTTLAGVVFATTIISLAVVFVLGQMPNGKKEPEPENPPAAKKAAPVKKSRR